MRNIITFVLLVMIVLYSQTVTWEKLIPFETDSDAPVSMDIDSLGNIFVACYNNGPNKSIWSGDTLLHSPNTKVLELDPYGNVLDNRDFDVLFNHAVKGIGLTESGYKLIGNVSEPIYHELFWEYTEGAWMINVETSIDDTLKFPYYNGISYRFDEVKTSKNYSPLLKLCVYDNAPSGRITDYLTDIEGNIIFDPDSLTLPDSLIVPKRHFYFEHINDFEKSGSDIITIGYFLSSQSEGYQFIMKTNQYNTIWEIYERIDRFGISPYRFVKIAVDTDGDIFMNIWFDQDGDQQFDENEYFIRKYSSDGSLLFTSSHFFSEFEWFYNVGENQFIAKQDGIDQIFKFTDTGSGINIEWTYDLEDAHIARPLDNSFLTAGIIDDNIIIRKINATTGINPHISLPETSILYQNYPNPFNPTTEIKYALSQDANVSIMVYNSNGSIVADLINASQSVGQHSVTFDASKLSNGIFYYSLVANGKVVSTKKMLLLK